MLFSIFTVFGDTGNIQNKTITEEPTVKDDIILGVNLDEGTETVPPKEIIEEEIVIEEPEPVIEELPDIITVDVKLYNNNKEGFNTVDGKEYLNDIKSYLEKYAPDGMFLSAASAMAYTEGGAGKQGIYKSTNNCFGIRAVPSWEGYVYARSTGKVYKDYKTSQKYGAKDLFRAYDNMEDSVKDYVSLISGDYYCGALKTDSPKEYLRYIINKGYGETSLLNMWLGLIDMYDLKEFDK